MMTIVPDLVPDSNRYTGIGSLPHHNVDTALDYSFKMGIPFLPQIPIRNPWEFMIAQVLEGLPGLEVEEDGNAILNTDVWESQSHHLAQRLRSAFSDLPHQKIAFEGFEPFASTSSCWQPFLWELQERKVKLAKIQLAGPMTAQWGLQLKNGQPVDRYPGLSTQIFQLVLARALAIVYRMQAEGIRPLLFLDEPGLYALSLSNPKHMLCLQELKLVIQTLKKEGALVGLHCCGNTEWDAILQLGMDYLSIDASISLENALACQNGKSLENYIHKGGKLSLGVIPTSRSAVLHSLNPKQIQSQIQSSFQKYWSDQPELIQKVTREAIYTPACGLALQSISDAELILEKLVGTYENIRAQ